MIVNYDQSIRDYKPFTVTCDNGTTGHVNCPYLIKEFWGEELTKKYNWMVDFCKENELDPTVNKNWEQAMKAYEKRFNDK